MWYLSHSHAINNHLHYSKPASCFNFFIINLFSEIVIARTKKFIPFPLLTVVLSLSCFLFFA